MQKTIFMTVGESSVARNLLRTDFWSELIQEPIRIVLLVKKSEELYYTQKFAGPNIVIQGLTDHRLSFFERVLKFFSMHGFVSGTKEVMEQRGYEESKKGIPPLVKKIFGQVVSHLPFIQRAIRHLELSIAPNQDLAEAFSTYLPSMVFCTTIMSPDVDIPVAREAKRRHIHLVAMTRSWDNLTTYGFIRVMPDAFIAQNEFLKDMAVQKQGIPEQSISISGIPHYDQYTEAKWIEDRATFFQKLQLDPNKKMVLYGAVGDFLFPSEGSLANTFEKIGEDLDLQFVFRAHPAFDSSLEKIKGLTHVSSDRNANYLAKDVGSFQMEEDNIRHLINSLYHADVVLTSGSSFLIDGPAFNKPTVTIAFDGEPTSYWNSVARFYDKFDHILDLLQTHGVKVAHDPQELTTTLAEYLANPQTDHSGREAIIKRFVAPYDGQASHRLFEILKPHIYDTQLPR